MGDQTRAPGEVLARLSNYFLPPRVWPSEFSGDRQDARRDSLFKTTGKYEPLNMLGGTQAGDLIFSHSPRLSATFQGGTRCCVEAGVIALPTTEDERR